MHRAAQVASLFSGQVWKQQFTNIEVSKYGTKESLNTFIHLLLHRYMISSSSSGTSSRDVSTSGNGKGRLVSVSFLQ